MKAIFLAALALGMCSNPDIEHLEQKVERLTERQAKNTSNLTAIETFVHSLKKKYKEEVAKPEPIGVVANMLSFQVALQTYAIDWGGIYPNTVEQLIKEAKLSDYYIEFENPSTGEKGWERAAKNGSAKENCEHGMVYYHFINAQTYDVTGCTIAGKPALNEEGQQLILSNY